MFRLLRHRDFALLWAGQSVSELGSAVTLVAFPLAAVLALHASAFEVSLVTAAASIAWLVIGLPAGVWVDRLPRRALLIATDAGRALLMATIPLAWWLGALSLGQLVAVAFGVGVLSVLFDVGYPAYLPSVVSRDRLVEGNGILSASESAANVAGPGLGGALVQLIGAPVAMLADAVSFVMSAGSIALMRTTGAEHTRTGHAEASHAGAADRAEAASRAGGQPGRLGRDIVAGLRYVGRHPLVRTVAVAGTLANFALGGYLAVVVVFLSRQVGLGPGSIGALFTLTSVGGVFGSLVAVPLAAKIGDARVMLGGAIVTAAFGLLIPLTSGGAGVVWFVAGGLPLSVGIAGLNVCVRAAMQIAVPDEMLGRVVATTRLFTRGAMPAGALVAGALASVFTPRAAVAILMALLVLTPVWLLWSPVRRVRDLAQLAPVPANPPQPPVPAGPPTGDQPGRPRHAAGQPVTRLGQ